MDDQNTNTTQKKKGVQISIWTLLMIVAFAAIGAATAKVQQMYDGSSDVVTLLYGDSQTEADTVGRYQLRHDMISYAAVGAGFGLVVGLLADGFRSQNRE